MLTPFRTVVIFIFVCMATLLALPKLRVDLLPEESAPEFIITYQLPSSSAEVLEQDVTATLENALSQLPQLYRIISFSRSNSGQVNLEFDQNVDVLSKKLEIALTIRSVYDDLPPSLSYPVVAQTRGKGTQKEASPLVIYTITGPASNYEIRKVSHEAFYRPLSLIAGIEQVTLAGSENLSVWVTFDQSMLNAYHVSIDEVKESILRYNNVRFIGVVAENGRKHFVKAMYGRGDLISIQETPINGSLRLKDVAKVQLRELDPQNYLRINGQDAITLRVYKKRGENAVSLAEEAKQTIENHLLDLPNGYQVHLEYDSSEFVRTEIHKILWRSALSLVILVICVSIFYRNWRYILILLMSLSVGMSLTVLFGWFFHVAIHLYTLSGVALSLGLMIDNAIVMTDHYDSNRNRRIFLALLGATFTTIIAVLLVFALPYEDRQNLSDFASIVAIALMSSLVTSLSFTPALYNLLFQTSERHANVFAPSSHRKRRPLIRFLTIYFKSVNFLANFRKTVFLLITLLFGIPLFLLPASWRGHSWYNQTIGSVFYQKQIRPYSDKILGGTMRYFAWNVFDKGQYREPVETKLHVIAELPQGGTLPQLNSTLRVIEDYLVNIDGVAEYVTTISSAQSGNIAITFKKNFEHTVLPINLKSALIERTADYGGMSWEIFGVGQGFVDYETENISNLRILMKGYNYNELAEQTDLLAEKLLRNKRVKAVNTNERLSLSEKASRMFHLSINSKGLSPYDLTRIQIVSHLKSISVPVGPIGTINLSNSSVPLMLVEKDADSLSAWTITEPQIDLDGQKSVKLNSTATLSQEEFSGTIYKEDRQYCRVVGFDYLGTQDFANKFLNATLDEMNKEMPIGFTAEAQDWNWDQARTTRQYSLIVLLILANYFICCILFESLKLPFFITIIVPVSFIGIFLIFSVFQFYFDQGGYAAFVLLTGLVLNSAIFIIHDLKNSNTQPRNPNRTLLKIILKRSKIISITLLSTSCSLIPFLLEGQNEVFWFSFGVGVISGLAMSLFAIFFLLPTLMWKK